MLKGKAKNDPRFKWTKIPTLSSLLNKLNIKPKVE